MEQSKEMEYIKDHGERKHALLSPSGSHRWLTCTASARAAEALETVEHISEASAEGTVAHELAEYNLNLYLAGKFTPYLEELQVQPELQGNKFVTGEMKDYVIDYIGFVTDIYEREDQAEMYLERKFDLSNYVPESGGSADVSIVTPKTLYVIDLKFGKGVRVKAHKNSQLMMYALGIWNTLTEEQRATVQQVKMYIAQVRLGDFSEYILTPDALLLWAEEVLTPKAEQAFTGHGATFVTGEHCKYCKFKPVCRKHKDELIEAFDTANETAALSLSEIGDLLTKMDVFTDWIEAVKQHAYAKAMSGEKVEGWKVVEGRSVRKIVYQAEAVDELRAMGLQDCDIYNTSLKGITDLERMLGKKAFAVKLGDYVKKVAGKPTLVPEADHREAIAPVEDDFEVLS
ncbi:hypothetical protein PM708P2_00025 [Parabacteroides phage PM708P2]|nr:hypothetical protein PM708P2_00025 [Parabacteroides phage PM708P2]